MRLGIAFKFFIATIVLFASVGCSEQVKLLPNSESAVIKTIAITPPSPNLPVLGSAQFHAIANYADGSTADITSTAVWASSAATVAPFEAQGLLTCKTSGTSDISASAGGVATTAPLTCFAPQIIGVKLESTPLVIRSNSPFEYQLLADYSDGTTADVTASATWVTDPSIASVNSAGLVNCNNPGETTISGTFSGMTARASFTCVLRSITPKPGFVESAKTFDGPFASWINVKTAFGAKGDGVTDDTAALQAALDSLVQHRAVLWIPVGTNVIKSPLTITGLNNITILGEDPLTTTISWYGPAGGTMLTLSGLDGFNVGRLTLDGRGSAGVNLEVTWNGNSNYYPTRNLIHDSRIINTETGLHAGFAGETTVDRVHFDHNTRAGIILGTYNTLNWSVLDCLFTDDAIGVTNWYGAGAFSVSNSVFVRSTTSDIAIGDTGSFSLRSNMSVDSNKFFLTAMTGAPANIIIQGNTIYHPGSSPIATGTPGSLMILDNQFLDLDASFNVLFSFCNSPINFISVGNTYAVPQPFGGNIGHYTTVDEAIDPADSAFPWTVPTEVYIPQFSHRQVFDVASGSSDAAAAVQAAVNAATAVGGIVHLPVGNYNLSKTVEIPLNANIGILGDGALSYLVGDPTLQGPVLRSYGKTVQVEDVGLQSYSEGALVELHVPDTPSTRILCDECAMIYQETSAVEWNGLDDAAIEFRVPTLNGTLSANVHGGTARQNGYETLGSFGEFMSSTGAYQVDLGGQLLFEDGFHDAGQGNTQFTLIGDGRVTQQGGGILFPSPDSTTMTLHNYKGQLSLLGAATNGYVNIAAGSPASVFVAGVIQESGLSPFLKSEPSATVVGLSNSETPDNDTPSPLPDTPSTPSYIEHMMSMARTQILSDRKPVIFDSTTVKMTRILAVFGGVGLRVINSTSSRIDGSYSITPPGGGAALPQGSCESGEITMAGTWTLQDGGDGFLGLSRTGAILSEGLGTQSDGHPLIMATTMSSARDRWIVTQIGDGSVKITNRATGDLLTQAPGGCAYGAKDKGTVDQHWLIDGAN